MVRRRSAVRIRMGAQSGIAQVVEQAAHNRCVTGSSPVTATHSSRLWGRSSGRLLSYAFIRSSVRPRSTHVAATDVRPKITLACVECKERNYITKKNRRNDPDRLELKKFCPRCKTHTAHRETR